MPHDRDGSPLVMIVNQTLAQRLWPNLESDRPAVNGSARGGPKTVVGVVADVRAAGPGGPIEPEFYQPFAQLDRMGWDWTRRSLFITARTRRRMPAALGACRPPRHRRHRSRRAPVFACERWKSGWRRRWRRRAST